MSLWRVHVELTDDPATASYDVTVVARTARGAKRMAVNAAKSAYYIEAGGWALAPTLSTEYPPEVDPYTLPKSGIVAVSGGIGSR